MTVKIFIYFLVMAIVLYALDSVNINAIFKKNKIFQARLFYFLLGMSITYLITNFIYDFFMASKII